MDRRGHAVSRVSTRRRARTRTGGAVFRPRARQRQRCRLGCRLGRRRGERRDLTGRRARERGGADATRDPRQPRARRVSRRVRRAPGSRRAAHARLRRGGTDAPPRGITPRGRGYGILPSVAPHGAQMCHTSRPRGAQIQSGGVQGARYSVLRRGVTRVSARRRAVGDARIGGRNGGRPLDAGFGFKRLGGARGEMESRDGTSSFRARATGCARGFDPRRGRVFPAIVGVREAPTRGDAIHLPPRVSLRREVRRRRRRRRRKKRN